MKKENDNTPLSDFAGASRCKSTVHQPVFKIIGRVPCVHSGSTVESIKTDVLKWISEKVDSLPEHAWRFASFEQDVANSFSECIALDDKSYWSVVLHDSDQNVPGRMWATEITVATVEHNSVIGIKQSVSYRGGGPYFTPGIPKVLKTIVGKYHFEQDFVLRKRSPWILQSCDDVEKLVQLLCSVTRSSLVHVVSLSEDGATSAAIDFNRLSLRTIGMAHVVVLPFEMTDNFLNIVGQDLGVYGGWVRTYKPGFNLEDGGEIAHPKAGPYMISGWGYRGKKDFEDFLVKKSAEETVRKISENYLPSFSSVKRLYRDAVFKMKIESTYDPSDRMNLALEEIDALKQDVIFWEEYAKNEAGEKALLHLHIEEAKGENRKLKSRLFYLESCLQEASESGSAGEPLDYPKDLDGLESWTEKHLAGKIYISNRAFKACKGLNYSNIELLCRALILLSGEYREMRLGLSGNAKNDFDSKLQGYGLKCERVFSGDVRAAAGNYGKEYYIDYHGEQRLMDLHIKNGGNTRDPKTCLRIYFFWDDEDQRVVVGYLPKHLSVEAS